MRIEISTKILHLESLTISNSGTVSGSTMSNLFHLFQIFFLIKPKAMSGLSATRYGSEQSNPIRLDLYYPLITTPPATTTKSCSMG